MDIAVLAERQANQHKELKESLTALNDRLDALAGEQRETNGRIGTLELWRAQVKGFLVALTLFSALPATAAAIVAVWAALTGAN